jgi:hypothetical protein
MQMQRDDVCDLLEYALAFLNDDQVEEFFVYFDDKYVSELTLTMWEVTFEGYDPAIAETDDRIYWVAAARIEDIELYIFRRKLPVQVREIKKLTNNLPNVSEADIVVFESRSVVIRNDFEFIND